MTRPDSPIVRPARVEDARGILALFPKVPVKDRLWQWQYYQNPLGSPLEGSVVLCDSDRIIGFNGALPVHVQCQGTLVKAYWSVDSVILPEYRGLGLGVVLKNGFEQSHPILMALGSSPRMLAIYRRRNWQRSPWVSEYFFQCHGRNLREFGKEILQWCRQSRHIANHSHRVSVVPVTEVATLAGQLWERVAVDYPNAVCRTEDYIRWKYVSHPLARYEAIRVDDWDGNLRAMGVVRSGRETTRLVDYVGPKCSPAEKDAIVSQLLTYGLRSRRIHCLTTDAEFKRSLESCGFLRWREASSLSVLQRPAADLAPKDWFVMTGDSDGDLLDAAAEAMAEC